MFSVRICHANNLLQNQWKQIACVSDYRDELSFPSFEHSTGLLLRVVRELVVFEGVYIEDRCVPIKLRFSKSTSYQNALDLYGSFDAWRLCDDAEKLLTIYNEFLTPIDKIDISLAVADYALQWAGLNKRILQDCLDSAIEWRKNVSHEKAEIQKAFEIARDCSDEDCVALAVSCVLESILMNISHDSMNSAIYFASHRGEKFHMRRIADVVRKTIPFYEIALRMAK